MEAQNISENIGKRDLSVADFNDLWSELKEGVRFFVDKHVLLKCSLKGCGMGPWLVLVSPSFREI